MKADVKTRWNSTYEMAVRALFLRKYLDEWIDKMHEFPKIQLLRVSEVEWRQVAYVICLLRPFMKWTKAISTTKGASIHVTFQAYNNLFDHLSDREEEAKGAGTEWTTTIEKACAAASDKLAEYYSKTYEPHGRIYSVAFVLDPARRMLALRGSSWEPEDIAKFRELVLEFYDQNYRHYETPAAPQASASQRVEVGGRFLVTPQ